MDGMRLKLWQCSDTMIRVVTDYTGGPSKIQCLHPVYALVPFTLGTSPRARFCTRARRPRTPSRSLSRTGTVCSQEMHASEEDLSVSLPKKSEAWANL